jgi:hypothetical protein
MLTAIITFNGEFNAFSYSICIQQFWMLTATLNFLFMKLKMHPVILEKSTVSDVRLVGMALSFQVRIRPVRARYVAHCIFDPI